MWKGKKKINNRLELSIICTQTTKAHLGIQLTFPNHIIIKKFRDVGWRLTGS